MFFLDANNGFLPEKKSPKVLRKGQASMIKSQKVAAAKFALTNQKFCQQCQSYMLPNKA